MSHPNVYFLAKLLEAYRGHTVSISTRTHEMTDSKIVRLSNECGLVEILTSTTCLLSEVELSKTITSTTSAPEDKLSNNVVSMNRRFIPLVKIISVQLDDDGSVFDSFWKEAEGITQMDILDGSSLVPLKCIDENSWIESKLDPYVKELGYRAREQMYDNKLVHFFLDDSDDNYRYVRRITKVFPGIIFTNDGMVCVTSKIEQMIVTD